MGYPYGQTYLEQIQSNPQECEDIRRAYFVLKRKEQKDRGLSDVDFTLAEELGFLAEAFEIESSVVSGIPDTYHFMFDILDALLTPKEHNQVEQIICTTKNEEENSETL